VYRFAVYAYVSDPGYWSSEKVNAEAESGSLSNGRVMGFGHENQRSSESQVPHRAGIDPDFDFDFDFDFD
jgi:hypothetical protein